MAEIAESEKTSITEKEGYNFDEETLVEIKIFVHEKMEELEHPESPDYQAVGRLEKHVDRRLKELIWKDYKLEKGIG